MGTFFVPGLALNIDQRNSHHRLLNVTRSMTLVGLTEALLAVAKFMVAHSGVPR